MRVLAGETVPADAIVRAGAGLVDETAIRGTLAPVREVTGDQVLAGSRLRAGSLDVEVRRTGQNTRAAQIAQSLIETTVPAPRSWVLNRDAEEFARRAVAPTLIAAGTGLLVGGTTTAGAVLRPDYATGIGLAMPLEVLRGVKLAIRNGVVVRVANALRRLAAISWIVLDDHPTLHRVGCNVAEIRTKRLDENRLLPAVAAAGVWLGDERGAALVRACRERGLIVRHADLREIESDGVVVEHRGHLVRLRGRPVVAGAAPSPLIVEIDARRLGVLTGQVGRADSLARVTDSLASQPPVPSPQSLVFIVWDNPPIVIGAGSYLDRLAGLAGARNVFHDIGSPSAQVSIETIAARDPDFIAVLADSTMRGPPRYAARPEWRVVRAVRERRFLSLPGQLCGRPTPRVAEAVGQLRRLLATTP